MSRTCLMLQHSQPTTKPWPLPTVVCLPTVCARCRARPRTTCLSADRVRVRARPRTACLPAEFSRTSGASCANRLPACREPSAPARARAHSRPNVSAHGRLLAHARARLPTLTTDARPARPLAAQPVRTTPDRFLDQPSNVPCAVHQPRAMTPTQANRPSADSRICPCRRPSSLAAESSAHACRTELSRVLHLTWLHSDPPPPPPSRSSPLPTRSSPPGRCHLLPPRT
ncbi:UNVERIFIED_CONTAM: hypothetical protein Sangu_0165800 [Sesamum angustifolium]|uniref:Uncharacterized protein n=1 Tax=Sesamum angustifolium TaxID=2727405 RepID=A0AAW2RL09_9LAMI